MEKQKPVLTPEEFTKRIYKSKGLPEETAAKLARQTVDILHANISFEEKMERMRQLDRDNGVPEDRPRLPGVVPTRSLYIAGEPGGVRPFPGPIYK